MKMQSPHAYYLMGVILQQGVGVKQDKTAALSYFRKSADMGNRYAQAAAGEEIIRAFQQQPEPTRGRGKEIGRQILECALSQDLAEAGRSLEVDYLVVEKDLPTALGYLQKVASPGDEQSLWRLHSMFDKGKFGLSKDTKRASCYYGLLEQLRANPEERFPDVNRLCPL